jgi:hypothetical protein
MLLKQLKGPSRQSFIGTPSFICATGTPGTTTPQESVRTPKPPHPDKKPDR